MWKRLLEMHSRIVLGIFTSLTSWPSHTKKFLSQTFQPSHPLLLHPGSLCAHCSPLFSSLPCLKLAETLVWKISFPKPFQNAGIVFFNSFFPTFLENTWKIYVTNTSHCRLIIRDYFKYSFGIIRTINNTIMMTSVIMWATVWNFG